MKLYYFSRELNTYVRAKWVKPVIAVAGIFAGVVITLGIFALHHFVDNAMSPRSAASMLSENDLLRQQISLIVPRVELYERALNTLVLQDRELHLNLRRYTITGDSASGTMDSLMRSILRADVQSSPRSSPYLSNRSAPVMQVLETSKSKVAK